MTNNNELVPRIWARIALSLVLFGAFGVSTRAQSNEYESDADNVRYRDGRFLELAGGVTIQRADDAESDEVVRNMPLLPGDRVWTDGTGRAEILFSDGEVFRLSDRSKVDYLGRDRDSDERLGFRIFSGSFQARLYGRTARRGGFELRVPGGYLRTTAETSFRVDVYRGETTVSVLEGAVQGELRGERLSLRAGERVIYNPDEGVIGPRSFQRAAVDGFSQWCDDRDRDFSRARPRNAYLPDDLQVYGDELDRNGEWVYEPPVASYVYVPRVDPYWSPYTYGRWVYTLYGWTWVPTESWGFVTSHYGRWGHSARIGWHWIPRTGFSGAWVSWTSASWGSYDYLGWCATGWNGRPIVLPGTYGGRSIARGDRDRGPQWSYVRRAELGHRGDVSRRRVDAPLSERVQGQSIWATTQAPDRDGRAVARGEGRGRRGGEARGGETMINRRPSPGDSLPELRSDPMTTIPSPESRRRRGDDRTGYGVLDDEPTAAERIQGTWNRNYPLREGTDAERSGGQGSIRRSSPEGRRAAEPSRTDGAGDSSQIGADRARARDGAEGRRPRPGSSEPGSIQNENSGSAAREQNQQQDDPLLQRFFRSLQEPRRDRPSDSGSSTERDRSGDEGTARRTRPRGNDGFAGFGTPSPEAPESSTEPRRSSPPPDRGEGRAPRGSSIFGGGERSRPQPERSAPPREAAPRGGSGGSDNHAAPRRPKPDGEI